MKLIFIDADGTLFHHEGYIPQSAFEAVIKAQNNGHKICLCTGRQLPELYGDLLKIDYDGLITGSGSHIEVHGKCLVEKSFSDEELDYILALAQEHSIPVIYESSLGLFASPLGKEKIDALYEIQCSHLSEEARTSHGLHAVRSMLVPVQDPKTHKVNKISFLESGASYTKVAALFESKFDVVPATFAPFGKESGEISSRNITKALGMETLVHYYQADWNDVIAIGDGYNDICMFEKAAVSVAMGNAEVEVQKKADLVTTCLEDDGLANAFVQLGLI